MKARDLDRLVQVQRFTVIDDGFSSTESWADHGAAIWASKEDVSDGERARAGMVEAQLMTRFKVRYSSFTAGLTTSDRLTCEGVTFNIYGIKEGAGRRQWLEVSATARAA